MTTLTNVNDREADVGLSWDPLEGTPIPVLPVDDRTAVAVLTIRHVLELVPDPVAAQDPKRLAMDPVLQEYAELRVEVQRAVEGAKARNARDYGNYLVQGAKGERATMTPPITLYHRQRLAAVRLPGGGNALLFPHGHFFVAIDGETQRIALQYASRDFAPVRDGRVAVVIHHGKSIDEARQGFYDLNTKEIKPNAAVSISMDSTDAATRITRDLMDASDVLRGRVNMTRRQLRSKDSEVVTISALRTGIVTTLLGQPGLQVGSRSVELPEDIDFDAVQAQVLKVWCAILDEVGEELDPDKRRESLLSAPSILAGIGVLAHHAIQQPPRRADADAWTTEDVVDCLSGVVWSKELRSGKADSTTWFPWEGIAGKVTASGRFSIGGPKEVGYAISDALEDADCASGRRIRGERGAVVA